jgi:hypothetical protein
MIRIAVRTLTLNFEKGTLRCQIWLPVVRSSPRSSRLLFQVEDEDMRRFVLDKTAAPYFSNIVWFIRDQCTTLDSLVNNST